MVSYRTILVTVTVFSLLSIAGMREIRTALVLAILAINVFAWSWPRIDKWNKHRNRHILTGERELQVGNYAEAEKSLELAAAEADRRRSPAVRRSAILLSLAEARRKAGKLPEAEQTVRAAMALAASGGGQDRPPYANCLDRLASVYEDQGNYPQAQNALQEALKIEQAQAQPNGEILAKRSQRLALAYHGAGDSAAAAPHFVRSLELHEQTFGPDHLETGNLLSEAGAALQREGKHSEALRRLERALQIKEKALGADAPEVAKSLYRLALSYEESGQMEQAASQFERMLLLRQRQVGSTELELAAVFLHLSQVNLALGRLARAMETAQSAVLLLERGPDPELAAVLEVLAKIYERYGRPEDANRTLERAQSIWKNLGVRPGDPARSRQAFA